MLALMLPPIPFPGRTVDSTFSLIYASIAHDLSHDPFSDHVFCSQESVR